MSAAVQRPGVVIAHPSGNAFFRHLAGALRDAGRLAEVCTCLDWNRGGLFDRVLPAGARAQLGRRSFSAELGVPVRTHPWREAARLACGAVGGEALTRHEHGLFSVDAVYRDFDRWVARRLAAVRGGGIAYAYEDAADETFAAATRLGWRRIYDLPIAHWATTRRLLVEEAARLPEWEPTLIGTRDSAEKYARKDRELTQAEVVVCPSRFVADSLPVAARAGKRVVIAPFGSPSASGEKSPVAAGRPLRVLFAGSLSQRKGLADLFAAMRLLGRRDVELVVMGTPVVALEFYRRAGGAFTYEPPRPHAAVLALMRSCDVFCLPSIAEGRALVVQEALSQGLPAIVTAHTGADDAIAEGRNGFVVPIRAPEKVAEKIAWFADNRAALPDCARAAQASAQRLTWRSYGAGILRAIEEMNQACMLPNH